MKRLKDRGLHILYLGVALGMLVYAYPHLQLQAPWNPASIFGLIWLLFTAIIVAANVNALIMTEEKRNELARIKKAKALLWERKLVEKVLSRGSGD